MDDTARIVASSDTAGQRPEAPEAAEGSATDAPLLEEPAGSSNRGAESLGSSLVVDAEGASVPAPGNGSATGVAGANTTPAPGAGVVPEGCWSLPIVNRARLLAADGNGAALVGGKIVGSNASATNGFVDLARIDAAPAPGEWLELTIQNAAPYRYVKYYGPPGSYGSIAELELYASESRLTGAPFGNAGSRDGLGNVFQGALDGDSSTWFEGPLPGDNYVGLDLADGHVAAAPVFTLGGGTAEPGSGIELTAEAGASVRYTTNGADPESDGILYTGPVALAAGTTLLKAVAARDCALGSEVAQAVYSVAGPGGSASGEGARPSSVQSSIHIGNSLTDTIVDHLETVAADAGIALDFNRYSIPGAGTWMYDTNPTGGFGVANVQETLRTRPFDHVTMQPYPNSPCQAVPSSDGTDSDSGYLNMAWADARTQNPDVQMWVYQQWPAPVDFFNCITGGRWTRADWNPPVPQSWEEAVATELEYQELVQAELVRLNPDAPPPYIIPGGLALVNLKRAIEAGEVPGMSDFFVDIFQASGTDIHLNGAGAYFITLVFHACMFQQSPEGLVNDSQGELTSEQALIFQRLAWQTVTGYALSGVLR